MRTSFTHHFDRDDPLTIDVEAYISELIGIDNDYSEAMQGQRYQVGQQYRRHYDFFPTGEGYWQHEAVRGGQRTWTAMVSLTEPGEDGETDFPRLGIALRQQAGTLILWNNMDANGRPNLNTLHAGEARDQAYHHEMVPAGAVAHPESGQSTRILTVDRPADGGRDRD